MKVISGFFSDAGKSKGVNQDCAMTISAKYNKVNVYLGLVADGMGGYSFGEKASQIVSKQVIRWFERKIDIQSNTDKIERQLDELAKQLNDVIYEYGQKNNIKIGTTISLLLIYGNRYSLLNIGDTRIYMIKNNIKQLSIDQSIYDENKKSGILTECIGITNNVEPYISSGKVKHNSTFVICSDGFYHMITNQIMNEYLKSNYKNEGEIKDKIKKLIHYCLLKGERDNITALIMKVK